VEMAITSLPDGGVVCVSRDMTAKRDAENARAQAEAKYKMLVEQVAAISYIAEAGNPWGMAIRQPASRNDVWFLHGRVAGRFEGLGRSTCIPRTTKS